MNNDGGAAQVTPIVHDGIMFLSGTANTVQALDAKTGDLIWENRIGPAPTRAYGATARAGGLRRQGAGGPPPTLGKIYGLDAKTGKIVWSTVIEDAREGYSNTGGAIAIKGQGVLVGLTYCNRYEAKHCFISAYDVNTGKGRLALQDHCAEGRAGRRQAGITRRMNSRQGAETWIAGTYDPDLNTTYWGTAQRPSPGRGPAVARGAGATLYANSTSWRSIPIPGSLKWYYTHAPGENFDLDEVFERVLVDHGASKDVLTIGKVGILWKLNRVTGQYEDSAQTVFQNVFEKIDPKTLASRPIARMLCRRPRSATGSPPAPQPGGRP